MSRFGFKSGICLLIAPVPVHCFSITFSGNFFDFFEVVFFFICCCCVCDLVQDVEAIHSLC